MDELERLEAILREVRGIIDTVVRPIEAAIQERRAEAQREWETKRPPAQVARPYDGSGGTGGGGGGSVSGAGSAGQGRN